MNIIRYEYLFTLPPCTSFLSTEEVTTIPWKNWRFLITVGTSTSTMTAPWFIGKQKDFGHYRSTFCSCDQANPQPLKRLPNLITRFPQGRDTCSTDQQGYGKRGKVTEIDSTIHSYRPGMSTFLSSILFSVCMSLLLLENFRLNFALSCRLDANRIARRVFCTDCIAVCTF